MTDDATTIVYVNEVVRAPLPPTEHVRERWALTFALAPYRAQPRAEKIERDMSRAVNVPLHDDTVSGDALALDLLNTVIRAPRQLGMRRLSALWRIAQSYFAEVRCECGAIQIMPLTNWRRATTKHCKECAVIAARDMLHNAAFGKRRSNFPKAVARRREERTAEQISAGVTARRKVRAAR
jgi:hypothetical protein